MILICKCCLIALTPSYISDLSKQNLESLREELTELSTTLREERWYSEELKKEVERLQDAFRKKDAPGQEDNFVHKVHKA